MMLHFSSQSNIVYPANLQYSSRFEEGAPVHVAAVLKVLRSDRLELASDASR